MDDWIFIASIAVLIIVILLVIAKRQHKSSHSSSESTQPRTSNHGTYYSVSLKPGPKACKAVLAMRGKRFLASEAPIFPLRDCNSPLCECVYEHHEDRRSGNNRRHASINIENQELPGEKRTPSERRKHPPQR